MNQVFIKMKKKLNALKYFAPIIQIALCPVTILLLWTVLSDSVDSKITPELLPRNRDITFID